MPHARDDDCKLLDGGKPDLVFYNRSTGDAAIDALTATGQRSTKLAGDALD